MNLTSQVQTLDAAVCILQWTNAHVKGMNPSLLLPAIINSRVDWLFSFGKTNNLGEGKTLNSKPEVCCYQLIQKVWQVICIPSSLEINNSCPM